MKKTALSLMMTVLAFSSFAQDEATKKKGAAAFFARLDIGNRWNHAGDIYYADAISAVTISGSQTNDLNANTSVFDYKKASLGAGFGVNVGVGYMFSDHFGVDLGVNIGLAPKKYAFEYIRSTPAGKVTLTQNTTLKMPVYVSPSILLSSGYGNPFSVYTRLSLVFPLGGKLNRELVGENSFTGDMYEEDEEYDFYMSKGLQGALGASYRVGEQLTINCEVSGMSLTRYVKSGTITRAELNGVNELSQWDVEDIETTYTPNYFYDPNKQTATMPASSTVLTVPASSFGVSVGASFGLGPSVKVKEQTGFEKAMSYIRANIAYALPHAGSYYNSGGAPISGTQKYDATTGIESGDYKKGSYSSGLSASVGFGYMFNKYLGADLGVNIGFSPTAYTTTSDETYPTGIVNRTIETRAKMPIFLNPSILLSTGNSKGLNIYSRVGIALPFGGNLMRTYTEMDNITNTKTVEEEEFKFGMSKGLTGALGIRYDLTDALGLRAEVNGMSLTRYTKSSSVTAFTVNGVDELGSLNTIQRETEYQLNWTFDPTNTSLDAPLKTSPIAVPHSNFGVSLGVDFRF